MLVYYVLAIFLVIMIFLALMSKEIYSNYCAWYINKKIKNTMDYKIFKKDINKRLDIYKKMISRLEDKRHKEFWSNKSFYVSKTDMFNLRIDPYPVFCKYMSINISDESLIYYMGVLLDYLDLKNYKGEFSKYRQFIIDDVSSKVPVAMKVQENLILNDFKLPKDISDFSIKFPKFRFKVKETGDNVNINFDMDRLSEFVYWLYLKLMSQKGFNTTRFKIDEKLRNRVIAKHNHECDKCSLSTHTDSTLFLEVLVDFNKFLQNGFNLDMFNVVCTKCIVEE